MDHEQKMCTYVLEPTDNKYNSYHKNAFFHFFLKTRTQHKNLLWDSYLFNIIYVQVKGNGSSGSFSCSHQCLFPMNFLTLHIPKLSVGNENLQQSQYRFIKYVSIQTRNKQTQLFQLLLVSSSSALSYCHCHIINITITSNSSNNLAFVQPQTHIKYTFYTLSKSQIQLAQNFAATRNFWKQLLNWELVCFRAI